MLEKSRGIVLRTYKYSETSLIVKIFTEKQGVLSFLMTGIRASKNKRGNLLQSGQLLDIDYDYRENKNFQRIKEYKVNHIAIFTASDIKRSCVLTFIIELVIQLVKEGSSNAELFEAINTAIIEIDKEEIKGLFPIHKLLEISQIMGFYPSNNYDLKNRIFNLSEGSFQATYYQQKELMSVSSSELMTRLLNNETNFSAMERGFLLESLLLYYQLHISGFRPLKSHLVLREVLSI